MGTRRNNAFSNETIANMHKNMKSAKDESQRKNDFRKIISLQTSGKTG